ncbi:MAG: N-acetyltransferase [Desulfobacterales bacterium]
MNPDQAQQSPPDKKSSPLNIVKVENRETLNEFIRLLWPLYKDDPAWVPPLILDRRMQLAPKNPYFAHASFSSWVAYRDGKAVGRISAQVDQLHLDQHQDATGFFGMLESEDNSETFKTLLATAENWLHEKGMQRVAGPYNLSINQELGLLVEGFDTPPVVMMGHALPYYAEHIEENGYRKEKDLLAYIIDTNFKHPRAMQAILTRAQNRIATRSLRKSDFKAELNIIRDIFNDAWSQNWGFTPWTNAEFQHLGKDLKMLVDEDLISFASVDGEPAAFMVILPNINEAIRDLNGRLLPFGWLKLLWRLKVKYPETARIPLMGVRSRYHDSLLGAALAFSVIAALQPPAVKHGIKKLELSWILEDNKGMRNILEAIGGQIYKTYRIYSKELE